MLYPYKAGSASAKALSQALGIKQVRLEGSTLKGNPNRVLINWGSSSMSEEAKKCTVINDPEAVGIASNKLKFFQKVEGLCNIPPFTTDRDEAMSWLSDGLTVVGRAKLQGHSGDGIIIYEDQTDWVNNPNTLPLYVQYIRKKDEYRVHVVGESVVDVRRKALKSDKKPSSSKVWKVRNLKNGFVYVKEGLDVPDQVYQQALKAIKACGLDFGAVDIIWNNFQQKAYVLEINTAPGLEGSTIDNYAAGFSMFLKENTNKFKGKKLGSSTLGDGAVWTTSADWGPVFTSDEF